MPNDVAVAPVKLAAPKLWVFRAPRGRPRSQREVRERLRDGAVARDLARRALDLGQENHVDRALRRGGLGTVVRDRGVEQAYSRASETTMFLCLSTHRRVPTKQRPSRVVVRIVAPM